MAQVSPKDGKLTSPFRWILILRNKKKLGDSLSNPDNVLIASQKLKDFLISQNLPGIEFLPVTIFDHRKKLASKNYCIVNLVAPQDCINVKASKLEWNKINDEYISAVQTLVLDESKINSKTKLFRAKHLKQAIFIQKELADKIATQKFSNIVFWNVSEFRV